MKIRAMITGALIVGLFILNFTLHQILIPQTSTELALQQMNEDGSREALRSMEQLSNWIWLSLVGTGIAGIIATWSGEVKNLLRMKRKHRL